MTTNLARRAFIKGAPVAAAALAAPAVTLSAELPVQKVNRLGSELSKALDEYGEGKWHARIYPSKSRPFPVAFVITDVHERQDQKCLRLLNELRKEMLKLPAEESDGRLTFTVRTGDDKSRLTLGIDGNGEDVFVGFLPSNHMPADMPVVDLYEGPGVYEIKVTRKGKTYCPIYYLERVPYRSRPGFYYAASMRWKGRVENRHRYRADQIKIVRKLTGHAAEIRS